MIILIKNLLGVKKVFGLLIKTFLLILLVLTTCTCSGPRLMLGNQTLGNQTDYSLYFGKHAKQMPDLMECVILKTVGQDFHLCPQLKSVNLATISTDSRFGILSKSGPDAKKMFTDKVVPISVNYPVLF